MKIIVDAFGGDNAPLEIIRGAEDAMKESSDLDIVLVGKKDEILKALELEKINPDNFEIIDAPDVIEMEDEPVSIMKGKNNSSMAVGLKALANGQGDAFVSAGNTGALLVGSSMIVKRIPGIRRAALAPVMPSSDGKHLLIDSGANVECKPEYLLQFGLMGSVYMEKVMGVENPRVGLVNNGTEETKGTPIYVEAHKLLKEADINFVGNIEAREAPLGKCDVLVADGFTGNIILKLSEGMGIAFYNTLKDMFLGNFAGNIAALLVMKKIKAFKKKMDYKETGGAPLMGITKPVIKAHGNSDARAFKNAIKQAVKFTSCGVIEDIAKCIKEHKELDD